MEAHAGNADPQRPGRILAAERERQGLGPAEIAQRLRMSTWQVEALEADDYGRLPRGPFLRGFVRNYAKLLGLAPETVLAHLAEGASREAKPQIVVPSQNIRFDPLSDRMGSPYVKAAAIASVVVALGLAAMYWWTFIRNSPPTVARKPAPAAVTTAPVPAAPTPVPPPMVAEAPRVELPVEPVNKAESKPEPAKATETKAGPAKKAETKAEAPKRPEASPEPKPESSVQRVASTSSGGTLKLRFKGKSWVEIKDAGGRVILTGLNDPGSEAEVSGKPPFRVIVGNAPDVQLFVNDREFNLAPHIREAVARFTVD